LILRNRRLVSGVRCGLLRLTNGIEGVAVVGCCP
jgi:hypothetical protein